MRLALAIAAVALTACSFDFGFGGTRYRCGNGERCPAGQVCVAGVCETDPDAGTDGGGGDIDADVSGPCGNLTLLQDTFDAAGAGAYWYSYADTGATVGESGGQLVIDVTGGADAFAGYNSSHLYDLHGGWIDVHVTEVLASNTILEVRNHLGNVAQLVHEDGNLRAGIYNVAGEGTLTQRPWNPSEVYWRIGEDGGDMVWAVSTDRVAWTELHRRALPFDVAHVRGIVGGGGLAATTSRARFADVNAGPPNALYCPAQQLVDDFAAAPLEPQLEAYAETGCTVAETGGALTFSYTSGTGNIFCGVTTLHMWDLSRADGIVVDSSGLPSIANFVSYVQLTLPGTGGRTRLETTLENGSLEYRLYVSDTIMDRRTYTLDRTMHRYWRTRGMGTTAIFETSPDRTAWTERWRVDAPFALSPVELNIGAGHYDTITVPLTATVPGINAD
jgi:hypothetical protein